MMNTVRTTITALEQRGYTFTANEYVDICSLVQYTCPEGHEESDMCWIVVLRSRINICRTCTGHVVTTRLQESYTEFQAT